ncbi:MAG: LysR substrate-binding domain-containing protein [Polaromonas sp.]|nr:LysR substrate-binding domain-containing protein [Polaromonas sp.]
MALVEHLKYLRAACAVALTGSSVRAAQALHLSQSSVTRAVLALESAVQQVIFDRSGRGMVPTPQWSSLLQRCNRAFQHMPNAGANKSSRNDMPSWMSCRLALGIRSRHIQVLMSLAKTGSETVSASALGISQSAVHQTLVQLEHLSERELFARSRQHGLRLNEFGLEVMRGCKLCLSELQQADEVLAALSGKIGGRIVIGTLPFSVGPMLPKAVNRVMHDFPGLQVTVIDGTYDALIQQLRDAEIDMVIGALRPQFSIQGLLQETLFIDRLAVVARADHPLAQRKKLKWTALRDAQWIMPMPNTPAQTVFERVLGQCGLPLPTTELRVNSALMMQSLLMQSERLAMMSPRQIRSEIKAGLFVVLPLALPDAARTIGLIRRSDVLLTPGMQSLLATCRDVAGELAAENSEE